MSFRIILYYHLTLTINSFFLPKHYKFSLHPDKRYYTTQSIADLLLWYVGNLHCVLRKHLEVSHLSGFCLKRVKNLEATPEALRCTHITHFVICKNSPIPAEFALQYSVQRYVHKAVFLLLCVCACACFFCFLEDGLVTKT